MRQVNNMDLAVVSVLGGGLFVLAMTLVNVQYLARTLFVEHERAVDVGRKLADDEANLLLKVRKASLPGSIAEGAGSLGLEVARGENTVNLVVDEHHRVTFAPDTAIGQPLEAAKQSTDESVSSQGRHP